MNNYLEDIKKFLDSDTTEAKISKVVLGVIAVTGLVGFPLLAASLGSAIRVFSQFKKSKKYSP